MREFLFCLIVLYFADLAHRIDGHRCDDSCPYPWGRKGSLTGLLGEMETADARTNY